MYDFVHLNPFQRPWRDGSWTERKVTRNECATTRTDLSLHFINIDTAIFDEPKDLACDQLSI